MAAFWDLCVPIPGSKALQRELVNTAIKCTCPHARIVVPRCSHDFQLAQTRSGFRWPCVVARRDAKVQIDRCTCSSTVPLLICSHRCAQSSRFRWKSQPQVFPTLLLAFCTDAVCAQARRPACFACSLTRRTSSSAPGSRCVLQRSSLPVLTHCWQVMLEDANQLHLLVSAST
jgi:hypothetical protein